MDLPYTLKVSLLKVANNNNNNNNNNNRNNNNNKKNNNPGGGGGGGGPTLNQNSFRQFDVIDQFREAAAGNLGYKGTAQAERISRLFAGLDDPTIANAHRNRDITDVRRKELLALESMAADPEYKALVEKIKKRSQTPLGSPMRSVHRGLTLERNISRWLGRGGAIALAAHALSGGLRQGTTPPRPLEKSDF